MNKIELSPILHKFLLKHGAIRKFKNNLLQWNESAMYDGQIDSISLWFPFIGSVEGHDYWWKLTSEFIIFKRIQESKYANNDKTTEF